MVLVADDQLRFALQGEGVNVAESLPTYGKGAEVAGAPLGGGVSQGHAVGTPGVVTRVLQALVFQDQSLTAVFLGQLACSLGQLGSYPLSEGNVLHHSQVGLDVAEAQAEIVQAFGRHGHGQTDDVPGGDGVQPQVIAPLVEGDDRRQVADAAVGARQGQGLVLGSFHVAAAVLGQLAAGQGATEAGPVADLGSPYGISVDVGCVFKFALGEAAGGQEPGFLGHVYDKGRAVGVGPQVVVGQQVIYVDVPVQGQEGGHIGYSDPSSAPHGNGFQVLAAEDSAEPPPAGLAVGL